MQLTRRVVRVRLTFPRNHLGHTTGTCQHDRPKVRMKSQKRKMARTAGFRPRGGIRNLLAWQRRPCVVNKIPISAFLFSDPRFSFQGAASEMLLFL